MAFPTSPTNGQQANINGITYTYSSAATAWTVSTSVSNTFVSINVSANVNSGNVLATGLISATGNITGGNVLGGANVNATTHTGTTVSVTANVTGGNILTGGLISAAGNISANNATFTSNQTLSYGTANGVIYLDSNKVATSGSALVFDGTNLLVGSSSTIGTGGKFQITSSTDTALFKCTSATTYAAIISNVENTAARLIAFQYGSGASPTNVGRITTDGTNIALATVSGITFAATQSASADANTLDDYEEGTFTPTLGGTAVYDLQTGRYTKIGRLVYFFIALRPSSLGTGSTNTISGLPFAVGDGDSGCAGAGYSDGAANNYYSLTFDLGGSSSTSLNVCLRTSSINSLGSSATAFFQTNTRIYMSGVYAV